MRIRKGGIMSKKLEKIAADIKKAKEKRNEWDKRVKELEQKYRVEENTEIHEMVRAANLTPEQLAQVIALSAEGKVGAFPVFDDPEDAVEDETEVEIDEEED